MWNLPNLRNLQFCLRFTSIFKLSSSFSPYTLQYMTPTQNFMLSSNFALVFQNFQARKSTVCFSMLACTFFLHLDPKWSTVSGGKTQCTPSYVPKTCWILFFIYQRVILLQLYGVLPNLLRAHYVKTWFSANFWATSEKQRLSSKPTEWTGLTFWPQSLTIYNPWQILQGGGLATFEGELLHDPLPCWFIVSYITPSKRRKCRVKCWKVLDSSY